MNTFPPAEFTQASSLRAHSFICFWVCFCVKAACLLLLKMMKLQLGCKMMTLIRIVILGAKSMCLLVCFLLT